MFKVGDKVDHHDNGRVYTGYVQQLDMNNNAQVYVRWYGAYACWIDEDKLVPHGYVKPVEPHENIGSVSDE